MSRQGERQLSERLQMLIADVVKDEENKYCADCDAKGPRWASWNLGVLLCIRCAGIHRGLGVHISKVKSLNLDSWDPQQVAMLRAVGNRRARLLYEANLPDCFRRPQTDSALEQFIRAKYEQKRYVPSDFSPPKPDVESVKKDLLRLEQQSKRKSATARSVNLPLQSSEASKTQGRTLKSIAKSVGGNNGGGTLSSTTLSSSTTSNSADDVSVSKATTKQPDQTQNLDHTMKAESNAFSADLLGINFGEMSQSLADANANSEKRDTVDETDRRTTKESILALYALTKPVIPPVSMSTVPSGGLLLSDLVAPNGQNRIPLPSIFGVTASGNNALNQTPPIPSNTCAWNPARNIQASRVPTFPDPFGLDVLQGDMSPFTSKLATHLAESSASKVTNTAPGGSPKVGNPEFFPQQEWASFSSFQPAVANSVPPAQKPYIDQIQTQLASMQLRGSAAE